MDPNARPVESWLEAQIELSRRGFSCGPIDGVGGAQTGAALRVFQLANGLEPNGRLDTATLALLQLTAPAFFVRSLSAEDLAALQPVSATWLGKSEQSALAFETALEAIAERYHAHPNLVRKMNPEVDWSAVTPKTAITVPAIERAFRNIKAARIHIRLEARTLQAHDADGGLIAHFPVSIARRVDKRPVGELKVMVIAPDPNYTFDRFIEGDCNRLARSAAVAIAQQPGGTSFNPFLLYGGVGLGKTHLIQAIGNYLHANRPDATILYVSSEQFTNEFVQAIQHNRVSDFSLFYRQIDLLVIDDVQFFSGKEKTQEEFFHIFNALHQSGKQIILSADRPPRDIQGIEERLLSRFQWGLSADLQLPDFETRMAILRRKAVEDGIVISDDIFEFVAHNIKSNIRELEGALIRLLAHGTLHKREVDLALAKDVLRDLITDTRVTLTIDQIQRLVCEYFGIPEDLVRAKTRKREVVQARQIAMYFCKRLTQHSLKTIGLHFGGRDHSTVIHANQSVENQMDTDPKFVDMIGEISNKIDLRSR